MYATAITPSHLIDYARPLRRRLIESSAPLAKSTDRPCDEEICALRLDAKLRAAKSHLGPRWILHPAYEFKPRHSFRASTWSSVPGVLDEIRTRALLAGRL
jgi:hypothetical protein